MIAGGYGPKDVPHTAAWHLTVIRVGAPHRAPVAWVIIGPADSVHEDRKHKAPQSINQLSCQHRSSTRHIARSQESKHCRGCCRLTLQLFWHRVSVAAAAASPDVCSRCVWPRLVGPYHEGPRLQLEQLQEAGRHKGVRPARRL